MTKVVNDVKFKKLKIAMMAVACFFIVGIFSLVGVFAYYSQNTGTKFTILYSVGQNIGVGICAHASKSTESIDDADWFVPEETGFPQDQDGLYLIDANLQTNVNMSLRGSDNYSMDKEEYYYICFYMKNLNNKDAITLTVTDNSVQTNVSVGYFAQATTDTISMPFGTTENYVRLENKQYSYNIQPGVIYCFGIMVQCANPYESASYVSSGENCITFDFTQYSE